MNGEARLFGVPAIRSTTRSRPPCTMRPRRVRPAPPLSPLPRARPTPCRQALAEARRLEHGRPQPRRSRSRRRRCPCSTTSRPRPGGIGRRQHDRCSTAAGSRRRQHRRARLPDARSTADASRSPAAHVVVDRRRRAARAPSARRLRRPACAHVTIANRTARAARRACARCLELAATSAPTVASLDALARRRRLGGRRAWSSTRRRVGLRRSDPIAVALRRDAARLPLHGPRVRRAADAVPRAPPRAPAPRRSTAPACSCIRARSRSKRWTGPPAPLDAMRRALARRRPRRLAGCARSVAAAIGH